MASIADEKTEQKPEGFDLTVTHRDPKTGLIVKETPYTLVVSGASEGGKSQMWERPVGSGNVWNKRGEPIGRFIVDAKGKRRYDSTAKHVAFAAPETEEQKIASAIAEKDTRIAQLERELAGIKAEKEHSNKGKGA